MCGDAERVLKEIRGEPKPNDHSHDSLDCDQHDLAPAIKTLQSIIEGKSLCKPDFKDLISRWKSIACSNERISKDIDVIKILTERERPYSKINDFIRLWNFFTPRAFPVGFVLGFAITIVFVGGLVMFVSKVM